MLQVIPPGEVGTCFDDIGALDNVKSALREVCGSFVHFSAGTFSGSWLLRDWRSVQKLSPCSTLLRRCQSSVWCSQIVMLPLQRPELFQRGSLTRPTKVLSLSKGESLVISNFF